ncbi:MAG: hypothetical protein JWQ27_2658 [Ferruginibacter sp.]|nr:hypothetical protein [Ferruginibacter sp.]
MKLIGILAAAVLLMISCAPKTVPVATAPTPPVTVVPVPDVAKIDAATGKDTKEIAAGMETYTAKCGRCHGLKKVDDFTKEQWIPIMNRMAVKARLDSTEKANVVAYVQSHAKGA